MTTTYRFALVVEGFDPDDDAVLDAFAKADADIVLARQAGLTTAEFLMDGHDGLWDALWEGVHIVERSGGRVLRLDRDLVTVAEIAARTDRTRESIRLLVAGDRGRTSGEFPSPVAVVSGGTKLWPWSDVNEWFRNYDGSGDSEALVDEETATLFDAQLLVRYQSVPTDTAAQATMTWVVDEDAWGHGNLKLGPNVVITFGGGGSIGSNFGGVRFTSGARVYRSSASRSLTSAGTDRKMSKKGDTSPDATQKVT